MKTEIITVNDIERDFAGVERAAKILAAGGIVALPTETVYGIAANALDENAVEKIFAAKGRPRDNPLIVHISELTEIERLISNFTNAAQVLAQRFWPGPLTMVLPKSDIIPDAVSAGLATVAVRMPSHPVVRAIIKKCGLPLAAPSANLSGSPSPTTAQHCVDDLMGRVDLIVDGGDCTVGLESTVITLAEGPPRILRPGAITVAELRGAIGEVALDDAVTREMPRNAAVSSPGMKYRHYSPKTAVTLVHGPFDAFATYIADKNNIGALVFNGEDALLSCPCVTYGGIDDAQEQARRLFSALREIDALNVSHVFARAPEPSGVGLAVYNRLLRAAAFDRIYL